MKITLITGTGCIIAARALCPPGGSFRAPHHTASPAALGGSRYDGEVNLAAGEQGCPQSVARGLIREGTMPGVLLLDEAAEFSQLAIEAVRAAWETLPPRLQPRVVVTLPVREVSNGDEVDPRSMDLVINRLGRLFAGDEVVEHIATGDDT